MPTLPPPPVPQKLREMLKDYPEHIEALQQSLNQLVEKPKHGVPQFERAVWAIEDQLDVFFSEAKLKLEAAEAGGDAEAIAKAFQVERLMGAARLNMGGMPELWDYFQTHADACP